MFKRNFPNLFNYLNHCRRAVMEKSFTKECMDILKKEVSWKKTNDPLKPCSFSKVGYNFELRVNDFPEEDLYTVIVNGEEIANLNDWPKNWKIDDAKKGEENSASKKLFV